LLVGREGGRLKVQVGLKFICGCMLRVQALIEGLKYWENLGGREARAPTPPPLWLRALACLKSNVLNDLSYLIQ